MKRRRVESLRLKRADEQRELAVEAEVHLYCSQA